jgi:hypothetical protein
MCLYSLIKSNILYNRCSHRSKNVKCYIAFVLESKTKANMHSTLQQAFFHGPRKKL